MSYSENVTHAASALVRGDDANWELARLTFENTWNQGEPRDGDRVSMAQWCADVVTRAPGRRFGEVTGLRYKRLWRRWGTLSIDERVSWMEAIAQDVGVTLDALREEYGPRREPPEREPAAPDPQDPARYTPLRDQIEVASDEAKRFAFRRLANDPAVLQEAVEIGSPVRNAMAGLENRAALVRERQHEQMIQADPIARSLDQGRASADLMSLCDRYARDTERFTEQVADLLRRCGRPSEDRMFLLRDSAERLRVGLAILEGFVSSGQTELDGFLETVLARGADE